MTGRTPRSIGSCNKVCVWRFNVRVPRAVQVQLRNRVCRQILHFCRLKILRDSLFHQEGSLTTAPKSRILSAKELEEAPVGVFDHQKRAQRVWPLPNFVTLLACFPSFSSSPYFQHRFQLCWRRRWWPTEIECSSRKSSTVLRLYH